MNTIGRPGSVSMSGVSYAADPGSNPGEGDIKIDLRLYSDFTDV